MTPPPPDARLFLVPALAVNRHEDETLSAGGELVVELPCALGLTGVQPGMRLRMQRVSADVARIWVETDAGTARIWRWRAWQYPRRTRYDASRLRPSTTSCYSRVHRVGA